MEANELARTLKSLHISSKPLILANVWDLASLNMAFAASLGIKDEELTMEQNIDAIKNLAPVAALAGLPLSVDLQDGYGSRIREAVTKAVRAGAHGANLEDSIPSRGLGQGIDKSLYPFNEQVRRIQLALQAAAEAGLPDFVINARCDVFALADDFSLENNMRMREGVKRGKAYLKAGATTVFFWRGYGPGFTEVEVQELVKELDGRVAIRLGQTEGALSTSELGKIGVARISVGPSLFQIAMHAAKKSACSVLEGGNLEEV
ncbi:C6 transcription factor [Fusarium beomiforme]|uniref:C6 transcription factor n=1 Tax=Fusarium beomiforme TaxID=44412 RepID=A0A9P5A7Q1_9HYPO|nr:C6 transcription factor [Fusarium beomiforme]